MKHLFTSFLLLISAYTFAESATQVMTVDGKERSYIVYTPTTFAPGNNYSTLLLLHPLGAKAEDFAAISHPQIISDLNNCLVVFPQALDEQDEEIIKAVELLKGFGNLPAGLGVESVWGAGARIGVDYLKSLAGNFSFMLNAVIPNTMEAGYAELNKDVDDVKFINQIVANLQTSYQANETLYIAGASMGGAMTYRYAFDATSKASKIAVVNGFLGAGTLAEHPLNIPVCVFHSLSDEVVPYKGGIFNGPIIDIVTSIAVTNGCSEDYQSVDLPDIKNDGITVSKATFSCDTTKAVWFYLADNATHSQILTAEFNDVDYIAELEKFFFFPAFATDVKEVKEEEITIYPNPANDYLYCSAKARYEIDNLMGQMILSGEDASEGIHISSLSQGEYILVLKNNEETKRVRIVKK